MPELNPTYFRTKRRIVLIGSMSVYAAMQEVCGRFAKLGIDAVIPDAESGAVRQMSLFEFEEFKRRVSFAYLKKIRDPRTYAVLAINLDHYGILNYVGPNTFAEIAVAFAQSKRIYLLQNIPEAYEDELSAWRSIALKGQIGRLVDDFNQDCMKEDPQLPLLI